MFGLVMAGEKGILARKDQRSDAIFDRVGVHLEPTAVEIAYESRPMSVDVAQLLAEPGLGRDLFALLRQPFPERRDQRCTAFLADCQTLFGRLAADLGLDGVKLGYAAQACCCNGRGIALVDLAQLAAGMRPAISQ